METINPFKVGFWAFIAVLVIAVLMGTFVSVGAGQVGIKTRFGAIVSTLQPGLGMKVPFIEKVVKMDVQTQKEEVQAVEAASADLQTVHANVAVNFHLNPEKAANIYQGVGTMYVERVIDPAIQESMKATTAKFTAEQLITKREEVRDGMIALLSEKMKQFGINVDAVNITNFDFSPQFNQAIEAKVTAEQNALASKNKLEQIKYEAEQTVTSAKAQAESIQLQSQAANNEKYVSLKALEVQQKAIEKWDGHLPAQMIPGGALPFINLTK